MRLSQFLGLSFVRQSTSSVHRSLHHTPTTNGPNNVYTMIIGEVFDLTQVAATYQRVVTVIPTKTVLQYGEDPTNLFPVQVSALCNDRNRAEIVYIYGE
ncbi:hypothetical protein J3R83DRAFT_5524 [Lanmaoa asiatica]|nr:hypothetical protein J3R83DRAFT_5524 [Lanmaoa asiatica]